MLLGRISSAILIATAFILSQAHAASWDQCSGSIIGCAKSMAEGDFEKVKTEHRAQLDKTYKIDPGFLCRVKKLDLQQNYDRWFIEHASVFEKISTTIDQLVAEANQRLNSLRKLSVYINPVEGNNSAVKVSADTLIQYLQKFNARLEATPPEQQAELISTIQEDPRNNPLVVNGQKVYVSHTQMLDAMEMMAIELNASLKQLPGSFEVVFDNGGLNKVGLFLRIKPNLDLDDTLQVEAGQKYDFSLLNETGANVTDLIHLNEREKWAVLTKGFKNKINHYSFDGVLRYRKMLSEQLKGSACLAEIKIPNGRSGLPFVLLDEIPQLVKNSATHARYGMEFVAIDAEKVSFLMGMPQNAPDRMFFDVTQHSVTLPSNFEMQTTSVTQAQWVSVMGYNPSRFKKKKHCPESYTSINVKKQSGRIIHVGVCPNHPVERITWSDIVSSFLPRLNEQMNDGYTYRLPTEAEWEYSARAGTTTDFYSGNDTEQLVNYAWFEQTAKGRTHDVGILLPNEWGLFDMTGNVWQWVQDQSRDNSTASYNYGFLHTIRGGSWRSNSRELRSGSRGRSYEELGNPTLGFRLARTLK